MAKRYSITAGKIIDVPDIASAPAGKQDTSLADMQREIDMLRASLQALTAERAQIVQRAQAAEQALQAAQAAHMTAMSERMPAPAPVAMPAPVVNLPAPVVNVHAAPAPTEYDVQVKGRDGMGRPLAYKITAVVPLNI